MQNYGGESSINDQKTQSPNRGGNLILSCVHKGVVSWYCSHVPKGHSCALTVLFVTWCLSLSCLILVSYSSLERSRTHQCSTRYIQTSSSACKGNSHNTPFVHLEAASFYKHCEPTFIHVRSMSFGGKPLQLQLRQQLGGPIQRGFSRWWSKQSSHIKGYTNIIYQWRPMFSPCSSLKLYPSTLKRKDIDI